MVARKRSRTPAGAGEAMEIHSRDMVVTNVQGINPDKVRVTLGEVQGNPGGGPGAGAVGGGSFTYEVEKDEAPKVWDTQNVTVNSTASA